MINDSNPDNNMNLDELFLHHIYEVYKTLRSPNRVPKGFILEG